MAKIATDLDQSKKLAEILPIESADMYYNVSGLLIVGKYEIGVSSANSAAKYFGKDPDKWAEKVIPAWSLSALMDILPVEINEDYYLENEKLDYGRIGSSLYIVTWRMSYRHFSDKHSYEECETESKCLVDACVEMIVKLKEEGDAILSALKDQGYEYKVGKIVSIEPEPFKIEAGKCYMCLSNEGVEEEFTTGKVYQAIRDNVLINDALAMSFWNNNTDKFRPATEEEISEAEYQRQDKGIEKALRESQRMTSAEAKEALLPDGELTDFEKCFQGMCHEENQKFAKACCVSLMALARKQIVSEIDAEAMTHKEWLRRKDEPLFWPANTERAFYKQGIEDTLKAIEKGE